MAGTVPVFGKRAHVTIVSEHPATKKVNFTRTAVAWYKDPTKLSEAQLEACISLGEFAIHNCRRKTDTVTLPDGRRISTPAYIVMTRYPKRGEGACGGKTKEKRLEEQYRKAEAHIERLKRILEAKKAGRKVTAAELLGTMPAGRVLE